MKRTNIFKVTGTGFELEMVTEWLLISCRAELELGLNHIPFGKITIELKCQFVERRTFSRLVLNL